MLKFIQNDRYSAHEIRLFRIAGVFFIVAQLFIISSLSFDPHTRPFLFWLCNNFCFLFAIACFAGNMQMVKGISYIGLVAQLLWIADFVGDLIGFDLSSVTDYITIEGFTYANNVSIAIHMIIPLGVLALTFRIRPKLHSLLYAIPYIFVLYVTTLLWTPPVEDVNCIYLACKLDRYLPYTIYAWPLYTIAVTLVGYAIHELLYHGWHLVSKKEPTSILVSES